MDAAELRDLARRVEDEIFREREVIPVRDEWRPEPLHMSAAEQPDLAVRDGFDDRMNPKLVAARVDERRRECGGREPAVDHAPKRDHHEGERA
jgi:hypothetical protein